MRISNQVRLSKHYFLLKKQFGRLQVGKKLVKPWSVGTFLLRCMFKV